MRALLYLKEHGAVIGGAEASLEDDLRLHETDAIGVVLSDLEWRTAIVDITDPSNPTPKQKDQ